MSDSNRGILAVFAGIAALLVATGAGAFYGSLYSPAKKQYAAVNTGQGTSDAYQGVTESLPDIALIPDPVERAIANPSPQSGQDHEKRDLAAQESMAVWAFYMTLIAGVTALVTGVGTYFIAAQVKLTQKAIRGTEDATRAMVRQNELTEASQRAWLVVEPKAIEAAYQRKGLNFKWECLFKNVGQTVASEATFCVVARCKAPADFTHVDDYLAQARQRLNNAVTNVIPNECIMGGNGVIYEMVDAFHHLEQKESVSLIMAAVARYKIHADSDWHYTERVFAITIRQRWFTLLAEDFVDFKTENIVFMPLGNYNIST